MKCPYCGSSNLVWDNKNGTVICTECAGIVDIIYDNNLYIPNEIIIDFNKLKVSDRTIKFLRNLNSVKRHNLIKYKIDIENQDKYISEDGIIALELLKMDRKVEEIYNTLTEKGFFSGKKIKTRVALSFYLAGYRGDKIDNILLKLHISNKYFKKLIYKLPSMLKYQKLSEIP